MTDSHGLYKSGTLEGMLTATIAKVQKDSMKVASLVIVAPDGFEELEDTFGHEFCDRMLEQLGLLLKQTPFATRFLKTEFVIIFPENTKMEAGEVVRDLLRDFKNHPIDYDGVAVAVTVSGGVAEISQATIDDMLADQIKQQARDLPNEFLALAYDAISHAQYNGGDAVIIYKKD